MNTNNNSDKMDIQILFHVNKTDKVLIREAAKNERLGVGPYIRSHLIKEIETNNLNKAVEELKLTG